MANETAAEKAAREKAEAQATEAAEAAQRQADELKAAREQAQAAQAAQEAAEAALAAQRAEHEAELEALRADGKATGESDGAASTSGRTKGYELLADKTYQFNNGKDGTEGYTEYLKGDTIQLTAGRAAELIAAGAVRDPDAKDQDPLPTEAKARAKATQTVAPE